MRFIEVKHWKYGITLVNVDSIKYIYAEDHCAVIVFSNDCHFQTAETLRSVGRKIKAACEKSKTGGKK